MSFLCTIIATSDNLYNNLAEARAKKESAAVISNLFFCCFARSLNLLARSCLPQRSCLLIGAALEVLFMFGFVWFVLFFVYRPDKTSDCVMVRTSLLTSQGGTLLHALNQFVHQHKQYVTTWREPQKRRTEKSCSDFKFGGNSCQKNIETLWTLNIFVTEICNFFFGRRPLPFGRSHLRLRSGPAGIRTTTGSLAAKLIETRAVKGWVCFFGPTFFMPTAPMHRLYVVTTASSGRYLENNSKPT